MIRDAFRPAAKTAACAVMAAWLVTSAHAEEPAARPRALDDSPIEVEEVSIWVGNPAQATINAPKAYRNPMPGVVGTSRPKLDEKDLSGLFPIAPASFVQFFGQPCKDVDVDLKVKKGSFLAHWPAGKEYAGRIRWFGSDLLSEPPAEIPPSYLPEDGGLLSRLRQTPSALYLRNETRFERFLAYDADLTLPIPVRLRGGPDEYTIQNMTDRRLLDVVVVAPSDAGFRVGWVDELPSATPAGAGSGGKVAEDKAADAAKADPADKASAVFGDAEKPEEAREKPEEPGPLPAEGDAEIRARVDQFLNRPVTAAVESAPRRDLLAMIASQARLRLEFDEKTLAKDKVDLAKPTSVKVANAPARDALADVLGAVNLSYRITEEGRLFITTAARLAEAAGAKGGPIEGPPVKMGMSQPLKAADPSYREFTRDALARRLAGRGLRKEVVDLMLDLYAKDLFEPGELLVVAQLSREAIDEAVPLDIFPAPKKFSRVALVVVHGIDPRLQDRAKLLVQQLGDEDYRARESAEASLLALGATAVPALEEALKSSDVEILNRVERLLRKLNRNVP